MNAVQASFFSSADMASVMADAMAGVGAQEILESGLFDRGPMLLVSLPGPIVLLAYLCWVRRYFYVTPVP